jgi:hypothetical protein
MVVVVQLLAADENAPRHNVRARVVRRPVAITEPVSETVDDTRCKEWNPQRLGKKNQAAGVNAEEKQIRSAHQDHSGTRVLRVDVPLQPIVRRTVSITPYSIRVVRFLDVEQNPAPQHAVDAEQLRAVRIAQTIPMGMVLPMDGNPFARDHPCREPDPQAEHVARHRVQLESAVRLMPVQKKRHTHDCHVRKAGGRDDVAPPPQVQQSKIEKRLKIGHVRLTDVFGILPFRSRQRHSRGNRLRAASASHALSVSKPAEASRGGATSRSTAQNQRVKAYPSPLMVLLKNRHDAMRRLYTEVKTPYVRSRTLRVWRR